MEASKKHENQINTNNNVLNWSNMLLIEKMTKIDKQMDVIAMHAQIVRANTRRVGMYIIRYRQSLAEIDAFLLKIENRGFAFLLLARYVVEEEDWYFISFLFYSLFHWQSHVLVSIINKKGFDPSST